mmetsp:Transcript_19/g.66  ORF Transcript_19/g.66 Transcript_19/m.66 type:complete len:205 (-) Transcript_19:889-1503(-)
MATRYRAAEPGRRAHGALRLQSGGQVGARGEGQGLRALPAEQWEEALPPLAGLGAPDAGLCKLRDAAGGSGSHLRQLRGPGRPQPLCVATPPGHPLHGGAAGAEHRGGGRQRAARVRAAAGGVLLLPGERRGGPAPGELLREAPQPLRPSGHEHGRGALPRAIRARVPAGGARAAPVQAPPRPALRLHGRWLEAILWKQQVSDI